MYEQYGSKLTFVLDQQIITQMIMMKNMKIKFTSYDGLPLKKSLDSCGIIKVVTYAFNKSSKKYLQIFLDYYLEKFAE